MKHFDASPFPDGPCPDCFDSRGRMARLCKGGDNGTAAAQASLTQAAQFHAQDMANLRKQQRMAANAPVPDAAAPASPPQASNTDTVQAGVNATRRQLQRFGYQGTVNPMGAYSILGGGA